MLKFSIFKKGTAVANWGGAMEEDTISKNGRSSKSHTSRKILSILFVAVLTLGYAQAQWTFGARAGLNFSKISDALLNEMSGVKMKPGFLIGIIGDRAISDNFSIQPGLLFSMQRFEMNYEETIYYAKTVNSINMNYFQIPVNAQYKVDLGGMNLLLQAGPYFSLCIGGKNKYDGSASGRTIENGESKVEFGYGILEFGLGLGAGLQFGDFQTGIGYSFGRFIRDFEEITKIFSINVTYFWGK